MAPGVYFSIQTEPGAYLSTHFTESAREAAAVGIVIGILGDAIFKVLRHALGITGGRDRVMVCAVIKNLQGDGVAWCEPRRAVDVNHKVNFVADFVANSY